MLYAEFPEYVQALFKVNQLESMPACDVYGAFEHCYGGKGATELIDLLMLGWVAQGLCK